MSLAVHGIALATHGIHTLITLRGLQRSEKKYWPLLQRGWINDSTVRQYEIGYLVPVFTALSTLNHGAICVSHLAGSPMSLRTGATLRACEYAASAGVMLWLIASLSGVLELRSLVTLSLLNCILQYLGYAIDTAIYENKPREEVAQLMGVATTLHLVMWVFITMSFFTVLTTGSDGGEIPTIVYAILPTMFTLFSSFGILQFVKVRQYLKGSRIRDKSFENVFSILSIVSKSALTYMVYFGVLNAEIS